MAETTDGESDKSMRQDAATAFNPRETNEAPWLEVDPVEAMVEGVKNRGLAFSFKLLVVRNVLKLMQRL